MICLKNALKFLGPGASSLASGPHLLSAANHLEIPSNNPNLLSPDILNQRRGKLQITITSSTILYIVVSRMKIVSMAIQ